MSLAHESSILSGRTIIIEFAIKINFVKILEVNSKGPHFKIVRLTVIKKTIPIKILEIILHKQIPLPSKIYLKGLKFGIINSKKFIILAFLYSMKIKYYKHHNLDDHCLKIWSYYLKFYFLINNHKGQKLLNHYQN